MSAGPARMTALFEGPGCEQQVAAFMKLSYELPQRGPLRRAKRDQPLTLESVSQGPDEELAVACTLRETDLWELKPWTDVVVSGHVRSPGERPVQTMYAGVCVGRRQKWVRVFGDRKLHRAHGQLRFCEPEPFTAIELSWRRAYGGIDLSLPHEPLVDMLDLFRLFAPEQHPGAYPRNPAGRGWVIHDKPETLDAIALPNFESTSRLLEPSSLIIGDPRLWTRAPIPAGFGWWRQAWFPRSTLLGLPAPEFLDAPEEIPEVRTGWLSAEQVRSPQADPRFQSGASPGLRFGSLGLGERIELHGFSPAGAIETCLPEAQPEVQMCFERRPLEVELHLGTVELLPDLGLANLVWIARARPPTRLPKAMPRPGQRDYELLAGIDVIVDGERIANETVSLCEQPT